MPHLAIHLLGPFQVSLDGAAVTGFVSDKARALLAYLAVEADRPHRREALAGLLWPDVPEDAARTSLRTALANVRQLIGDAEAKPPVLCVTRQTVQWNRDSDTLVDVSRFTHLLEEALPGQAGEALDPATIQHLEEAVALYRGGFLEGFSLADSVLFEEWALLEREQLQRQALTALHRLAAHYEATGEPLRALQHAWRAVEMDPWPGAGQRQLMRLLALSGRREAALSQYARYRQLMAEELGVEPSEETRELYQTLVDGEWPGDMPVPGLILERDVVPAGPCPYRGLAAFREEDAPFFFGREAFVQRLLEAVQDRSEAAVPVLVGIVGASGCGKSSAVFAGLLPRLRGFSDGRGWLAIDFRPGSEPFRALAAALEPLLESAQAVTDPLAQEGASGQSLLTGELPLQTALQQVLEANPEADHLLLVVDQFEELYTLCPDPELRRRFLDDLLATAGSGEGGARSHCLLLLTLRADFMSQALAYRPFADALQGAFLLLGPMTRDELRAAIEKPAQKQGVLFETGLVERILDDVGDEPGNLPLLEFALTLLWDQQRYGWLTHTGYEQIGRVEGALARYADEVWGQLEESERERARQVFTQLVQPGEGTEDTRRMATSPELGAENWSTVQQLADSRLVVTGWDADGRETAELVHEALIQGWGQLRTWMEADRAFRTWQERLRAALRGWEAAERDEGALLRGAPLAEAEGWLAERGSELGDSEREFIQAGVALRDRRAAEREARRQRELEAAQKLAETESARAEAERQRAEDQSRATRRLRRRAVILAGVLVVAGVLAVVAFLLGQQATREREMAQEQARIASARELAAAAVSNLDVDIERSILLAMQAVDATRSVDQTVLPEALSALHQAVNETRLLYTLPHGGGVAYSPDGTRMATSGDDDTAIVWDAATQEPLLTLKGHTDDVSDVAFSPDGSRLATTSIDKTARVWDAATGEELLVLSGHDNALFHLAFSPDGKRLATTSFSDGTVIVWDLETGQRIHTLQGHYFDVYAVAFSPEGRYLVTGGWDSTPKVWDAESGRELFDLYTGGGWITGVAFSPDGTRLATAVQTQGAIVWDFRASVAAETGQELLNLSVRSGFVENIAFSPDGSRLATGNSEGTLQVWDAATGRELLAQAAHTNSLQDLAFSPDGERVASSSPDGTTKVWDLTPEGSREWRTLAGYFMAMLDFSPDGELFAATTYGDEGTRVIDVASGQELLLLGPSASTFMVAFSPDGQRLAAIDMDGIATVWELKAADEILSAQELFRVRHSEVPLWGLDFSPDGTALVTAGDDGTVKIWDAFDGRELLTLSGHESWINAVAYSPDGTWLATAGGDGLAKVWDAASGEEVLSLAGHTRSGMAPEPALNDVAFSPDGTRMATAGWDGTARIWDASTGEELHTLIGHSGWVLFLSFSPDGKTLATTSNDGTAKVWDVETGEVLFTLTGHTQAGLDVAFSPDGRLLATSSWDGTVRFYVLPVEELMALAEERVTRSLTTRECQQFLHLEECP